MVGRTLALLLASVLTASLASAQVDLMVRHVATAGDARNVAGWEVSADFFMAVTGGNAKNVVATLEYPPSLTLRTVSGLGTPCEIGRGTARCKVGDLVAATDCCRRVTVTLDTPVEAQRAELKVTITSETAETDVSNNVASAAWNLSVFADLSVSLRPELSRTDPGSAVMLEGEVNNWLPTSPSDLRVEFEATDATIEKVSADDRWTCSVEGSKASCTAAELDDFCRCSHPFKVTVRASEDRSGRRPALVMRASSSMQERYEGNDVATAVVETYRWIVVTTTSDFGAGSLRAAIEEANLGCAADPCKIAFEIPGPLPAEGWFTISPATALPPITALRVAVDGASQTGFSGDTNPAGPEVAIDGRFTTDADGLQIRSICEGVINDLVIGNFDRYGVVAPLDPALCPDRMVWLPFTAFRPDRQLITRNYLGTDPTGTSAWPNLRGLAADDAAATVSQNLISGNRRSGIWMWRGSLDLFGNRIGTAADGKTALPNGASGVFAGPETKRLRIEDNVIAYHPHMGVAIAAGASQVYVQGNYIFANDGLAIDHHLDGITPPSAMPDLVPNPPTLLSAVFDAAAQKTVVTATLRTTLAEGQTATLTVYAGERPGDLTTEVARKTIHFGAPSEPDGTPFTLEAAGDLRGKWLTATSTRYQYGFGRDGSPTDGTSEPGNSVRAAP